MDKLVIHISTNATSNTHLHCQKALRQLKIGLHCETEMAELCMWRNRRQLSDQKDGAIKTSITTLVIA